MILSSKFALAVVLQAAFALPAVAGQASSANPVTNPVWTTTPSADELVRNYPYGPMIRGVEGRTSLLCTVGDTGGLENCKVLAEQPTDAGFGDATVRVSKRFRMQLQDASGESVVGRAIRIPMAWMPPKPER